MTSKVSFRFCHSSKERWIRHLALVLYFVVFLTNVEALSSSSVSRKTPTFIRADSVSISYPQTWMKKLFSSVPEREYALENISLSLLGNEMTLLVGASASGKSTLLRVLAGIDSPSDGAIQCTNDATPIILDRKPDYDDSLTVLERVCQIGMKTAPHQSESDLRELSMKFCSTLELETMINQKPSTLTPSQQFSFGIACACIRSVASCADHNQTPILFLDELFDFEHSSVTTKVSQSLQKLSNEGAIIVISTHKPHHVEDWCKRKITLSAGKILLDKELNA